MNLYCLITKMKTYPDGTYFRVWDMFSYASEDMPIDLAIRKLNSIDNYWLKKNITTDFKDHMVFQDVSVWDLNLKEHIKRTVVLIAATNEPIKNFNPKI